MTLKSAIYVGHVRHRRVEPRRQFTAPLFMVYLDLAELDRVFSLTRLWGRSALSPARFRREDYIGPTDMPLDQAVRRRVQSALGFRPVGPVRMLTHLRYFGHIFNPVTFYYCFDGNERVAAIVAEVTNTPWKERHAYVLDARPGPEKPANARRWIFGKDFHVSPFLPMDLEYDWTLPPPAESLFVHMNVRDRRVQSPKTFSATLLMRRRSMTPMALRLVLLRFPLMTLQVLFRIYFEAFRLWLGGACFHPHPQAAGDRHGAPALDAARGEGP